MFFSGHVRNPGRQSKAEDKCGNFYTILTLNLLYIKLSCYINIW